MRGAKPFSIAWHPTSLALIDSLRTADRHKSLSKYLRQCDVSRIVVERIARAPLISSGKISAI